MRRYIVLIVFLIIGTVLFQGFQCASPEMTTARIAFQKQDYTKAEEFFSKELQKRSKNGEAVFLLAQVKLKLKKTKEAARLINEAEKLGLEPNFQMQVPMVKMSIWVDAFNKGITKFNQYFTTQEKPLLDSAIHDFDIALMVRPNNAEFYRLKGRAYEELGNEEKVIELYKIYTEKLNNEISYAKSSNIFIMMPRKDLVSKFGKPQSKGVRQGEDSLITDSYKALGNDIFIYYSQDEKDNFVVEGWRVNPPADWLPDERQQYTTINIGPFATLAEIYFNKATTIRDNPDLDSAAKVKGINENLNKSKEYTKIITTLDPTNIDANRFLVNLYESQGKSEEALDEIAKLVDKDPKNKFYLAQYGEIFLRLSKYDDAIKQYHAALDIDPEFCDVLRNIAAAYKNKAVEIIQSEQDKKDADKKYVEDITVYIPLLKKSAEYFDKSRKCEKYKNDLQVLGELAGLYFVLKNSDMSYLEKLNSVVDGLERLEQTIPDDQKEVYWLKMCKILGDMKSPKADRACIEAQKYLK
ncbi:tetratricopeptide repeat protein [Bacteroidota bacterium]